ncbi:ExbD/TolR family protein [Novosphingobium sp. Gsoil 351]|uniref:ExbD/TolR family protein n=1 Tax=Novosphingobium sp. Gsoil 351 TaxID=2675225 RepID=UPI0012B4C928|nr:ExbD/TolR family protein [Novosphingobium sp. Gsoil 351]QGN53667.1 protein TolR [Novosphingobium sp. Gsoil 351]
MAMGLAAGGRGRRRRRGRAPMAEINVTPLVDVMLVLLIIFMVTAPLLVAGVPVDLPESRANALDQEANQVTLAIDRQGRVFLDDVPVAPVELPQRVDALRCAGRSAAERPLITLRADRGLDYGRVMAVMGELNRAGCNSVSLVTLAR